MINRTYIVKTPTDQPFVDICVRSPTGSRAAPVANPLLYLGVTPPPTGWAAVCGDSAYYEIRSRTLRIEHLAVEGVAGGYTQRTNLGFILSVTPYGVQLVQGLMAVMNGAQLSSSLLAGVGGDAGGAIANTVLADPAYGPVIRIFNPYEDVERSSFASIYVVNFSIMERKDEDLCNIGGP
jgi:hypothetical protein